MEEEGKNKKQEDREAKCLYSEQAADVKTGVQVEPDADVDGQVIVKGKTEVVSEVLVVAVAKAEAEAMVVKVVVMVGGEEERGEDEDSELDEDSNAKLYV